MSGLIDLIYVGALGKSFADVDQVDRPGVKVGVIQGSPSDRFLSRTLKSAEIVRIPLSAHISADAAELLRRGEADVFGADSGVGYPVVDELSGAKILPGTFNIVRVAVACRKVGRPRRKLKSQRSSARRSERGSCKGLLMRLA